MESVVGLLVSRVCRVWYVAGDEGIIIIMNYEGSAYLKQAGTPAHPDILWCINEKISE